MASAASMRPFKLALLILALVPAIWLRGEARTKPGITDVRIIDLMPALRPALPDTLPDTLPHTGSLRLEGAWQISGGGRTLSTLSGLTQSMGGLMAVGDRGGAVWFTRPDQPGPWQVRLGRLVQLDWRKHHFPTDAEAVFVEPGSGDLIVGYEDAPMLERYSADLRRRRPIPLPVLGEWGDNQGAEAMARLADGRTLIVGEVYARWLDRTRHPGLIFPGTPSHYESPARFELVMPAGYRPSELAQGPDGRVFVLGRHFSFAGFRSVIAAFAAGDVRPGAVITPRVIARIDDPRIQDNYEGMTVRREADGSHALWLISDSNEMVWAQRTLLLKLRIGPEVH